MRKIACIAFLFSCGPAPVVEQPPGEPITVKRGGGLNLFGVRADVGSEETQAAGCAVASKCWVSSGGKTWNGTGEGASCVIDADIEPPESGGRWVFDFKDYQARYYDFYSSAEPNGLRAIVFLEK